MKNNKNNLLAVDLPVFPVVILIALNPYFITGLTEAEGSFSINKHKDKRAKYGVNISLRFKITMLTNETQLLNMVKYFFNCGNLYVCKDGTINYEIKDINSINEFVIPHFIKYPLRGTKYLDFIDFKHALDLIKSKAHYTKEGIDLLSKVSLTMNSFRQHTELYSPSHAVIGNLDYIPLSGHYINGFIAGDGCLALNTKDVGFGRMFLQISQSKNNKNLLLSIATYFKSPSKVYYHDSNSIQLNLRGIKL
jgi:hypothetical protein